jgi:hypothetical protein
MTAFSDMMGEGFAEAVAAFGGQTITTGTGEEAVSKLCVFNNVDQQRELRETGMMAKYSAIAELTRADATALGLYPMEADAARKTCVVSGKTYKRHDIEDDPHDPCVRLHLIPQRA